MHRIRSIVDCCPNICYTDTGSVSRRKVSKQLAHRHVIIQGPLCKGLELRTRHLPSRDIGFGAKEKPSAISRKAEEKPKSSFSTEQAQRIDG
ncbi:hypothetical protein TNCV_5061961 [Trichonephila clavipes]|nr:hypothetical protein TNCV_5061961 [Trichonephila clavipes]